MSPAFASRSQVVRVPPAGSTVMTVKVSDGQASNIGTSTAFLLDDTTGSVEWGSAFVNASLQIVIPDLFPNFTIFTTHFGAVFNLTGVTLPTTGIVRAEYQRASSLVGAFSRFWAATVGWRDVADTIDAVEDVYLGGAFDETMKENYKVRLRVWNELDVAIDIQDAFISLHSIAPDPEV